MSNEQNISTLSKSKVFRHLDSELTDCLSGRYPQTDDSIVDECGHINLTAASLSLQLFLEIEMDEADELVYDWATLPKNKIYLQDL